MNLAVISDPSQRRGRVSFWDADGKKLMEFEVGYGQVDPSAIGAAEMRLHPIEYADYAQFVQEACAREVFG